MQKKRFLKIFYLIASIALVVVIGFLVYRNYILADELKTEKIFQTWADVGGQGPRRILLSMKGKTGTIKIYKTVLSSCSANLIGFDSEAKVSGVFPLSNRATIIETSGDVGVHAQNRQYFIVSDDLCPKAVVFDKNGRVDYNIYSDEPNFLFQDLNADGFRDVATDWRDYDTDPLINGFRDVYFFQSSKQEFVFDHRENFSYQGEE